VRTNQLLRCAGGHGKQKRSSASASEGRGHEAAEEALSAATSVLLVALWTTRHHTTPPRPTSVSRMGKNPAQKQVAPLGRPQPFERKQLTMFLDVGDGADK
jgi:hypothetical protein